MHDQDDAASQFYLHRVSLTVDPVRVDGGYRDENDEPAAKLATTDLRTAGLDAVRYLNVHECAGSLSPLAGDNGASRTKQLADKQRSHQVQRPTDRDP